MIVDERVALLHNRSGDTNTHVSPSADDKIEEAKTRHISEHFKMNLLLLCIARHFSKVNGVRYKMLFSAQIIPTTVTNYMFRQKNRPQEC